MTISYPDTVEIRVILENQKHVLAELEGPNCHLACDARYQASCKCLRTGK